MWRQNKEAGLPEDEAPESNFRDGLLEWQCWCDRVGTYLLMELRSLSAMHFTFAVTNTTARARNDTDESTHA